MRSLSVAGVLFVLALVASNSSSAQQVTIERYAKPGDASVNSYLVISAGGVVLIDSQRVLSQGRAVAERIAATGKPLLAVLLTHPHPDHFGGLAAVLDEYPDTPVYASQNTLDEMRTDGNGFMQATREVVPDDSPEVFPLPTNTFSDGATLKFDGVTFIVDELGAGESESMTAFYVPGNNALFVGDVVGYEMTGFLLEGRSGQWMQQIRSVLADYSDRAPTTYPGHGRPGPLSELLRWQLGQLAIFRMLIRERLADGDLSPADKAAIKAEMVRLYPDHPNVAEIPPLLELNVEAVAEELN